MFDWFDKTFGRRNYNVDQKTDLEKIGEDMSKVIPFPDKSASEATKCRTEEPAKIYYRLGLTDNNRVSFQMGYSEILMTREGCQQVIDQLTFFMNQLKDDNES